MKSQVRGSASLVLAILLVAACAAPREGNQGESHQGESHQGESRQAEEPQRQEEKQAELPESNAAVQTSSTRSSSNAEQPPASPPAEHVVVTADMRRESPAFAPSQVGVISQTATCCPPPWPHPYAQPANTERYQHLDDNPVHLAAEQPVSTFSIDVDTGAYANVRRFLNAGQLPPQDAVRVEELINYFDYQYAPPAERETPFRVATEVGPAPWNAQALLLKIAIKGYEIPAADRPPANLVFLIDVSGSMRTPDKLPLLKNAFRLLAEQLTARDRVSMVVYAGSSGVVLEPTPGDQKYRIREAIDRLEAGGSTNGAAGIERAYQLARSARIDGGVNRVVLATDGDFNVGVVNFEALVDMAERERKTDVALTTLGFGAGNYNDELLERLADAGDGNYAYVDTLSEARKVLVSQLSSTLYTIAKDVKIQVEFNPAAVREYRLIGYQNRMLAREDFNNDQVDAGEIGAGHRVTAFYEIIPAGSKGRIDPLRYGSTGSDAGSRSAAARSKKAGEELAYVRLRYKRPDGGAGAASQLLEYPILKNSIADLSQLSADFRFAASVAAFGQLLRGGEHLGGFSYDDVESLAASALAYDGEGYRREFVSLVKLTQALQPQSQSRPQSPEQVGQAAP